MVTISKHNMIALIRRRDYLLKKIADGLRENIKTDYEKSEIIALNKAIIIAAEFIENKSEENNIENMEASTSIQSIEEYVKIKGPQLERTVLKEFFRNTKTKLVVAREQRGDRKYISFQNFHLDDKIASWKANPKTSIKINEIEDIINILKEEIIERDCDNGV